MITFLGTIIFAVIIGIVIAAIILWLTGHYTGTDKRPTIDVARTSLTGPATVVLSGGLFQNRLLLDAAADALERNGLRVLVPERLPPNDGGISYGQAAVAAASIGA